MKIEEIAKECGLELIQTTSEISGYPAGIEPAIIGFDTYEEAESVADRYDLSIEVFEKKDGWQLWYRTGNTSDSAFELDQDAFGPNSLVYDKSDIEGFKETEIDPYLEDFYTEKEKEKFIAEKMQILHELKSIREDEAVLTDEGIFIKKIQKKSMSYYYDVYTYAIGLIDRS